MQCSRSPKAGRVLWHSMAQANRPKTKGVRYLNPVEAQNPGSQLLTQLLVQATALSRKLEPLHGFAPPHDPGVV